MDRFYAVGASFTLPKNSMAVPQRYRMTKPRIEQVPCATCDATVTSIVKSYNVKKNSDDGASPA